MKYCVVCGRELPTPADVFGDPHREVCQVCWLSAPDGLLDANFEGFPKPRSLDELMAEFTALLVGARGKGGGDEI